MADTPADDTPDQPEYEPAPWATPEYRAGLEASLAFIEAHAGYFPPDDTPPDTGSQRFYDPQQPRNPKGTPGAGEWQHTGGSHDQGAHWHPGDVAHAPSLEHIRAHISTHPVTNVDEALHVGAMVRDRIHADMGDTYRAFRAHQDSWESMKPLEAEESALWERASALKGTAQHEAALREWEHAARAKDAAILERNKTSGTVEQYDAALRDHTLSVLGQLRELGGVVPALAALHAGEPTDMQARLALEQASAWAPRAWNEASTRLGTVFVEATPHELREASGGDYLVTREGAARIRLNLDGQSMTAQRTAAIHELGHRFEHVVPQLNRIEETFYNRRTDGERSVALDGYKGTYRVDAFADPYMGRMYPPQITPEGVHKPYEVLSVGQEWLLGGVMGKRPRLQLDPEFHALVLGMLAGV